MAVHVNIYIQKRNATFLDNRVSIPRKYFDMQLRANIELLFAKITLLANDRGIILWEETFKSNVYTRYNYHISCYQRSNLNPSTDKVD